MSLLKTVYKFRTTGYRILAMHPEWSTHPVDGSTFRWNVETGELAVNTIGEHPKGQRFGVILR